MIFLRVVDPRHDTVVWSGQASPGLPRHEPQISSVPAASMPPGDPVWGLVVEAGGRRQPLLLYREGSRRAYLVCGRPQAEHPVGDRACSSPRAAGGHDR